MPTAFGAPTVASSPEQPAPAALQLPAQVVGQPDTHSGNGFGPLHCLYGWGGGSQGGMEPLQTSHWAA